MKECTAAAPAIDDRLTGWLAVHEDDNWIAPTRIEVRGLQHPPVERHAFAHINREELDGAL